MLAIASGIALLGSACATTPFRFLLGAPCCVAEWSDARAIPEHRGQRIRFVTQPLSAAPGEQRTRGELVTSAAGGELSVIGLTPFGTRAFSAVQTGRALELDAGIARRLGLEPYYLLDALHRGLWPSQAGDGGRVQRGDGGTLEVENPACGYRTRFLVLPNEDTRDTRTSE